MDPTGMSDHELLIEVRTELRAISNYIHAELHKRPTRTELMTLLTGAGVLAGMIFGLIGVVS
ncbi:MAG: hypothetical protein MN733_18015 [Nitrososphaera sp.]|nr:hypothetical protein [Nitrososphaera sp.]